MADVVGASAAQTYRSRMRDKAERLGGGEDAEHVDGSDFRPAEKLYAGVKTGMRPISRQARADGGPVSGGHAAANPSRAPRKSGGGFGEAYINRDEKAANAEREGEYPNGGMKAGGRARRADGGGDGDDGLPPSLRRSRDVFIDSGSPTLGTHDAFVKAHRTRRPDDTDTDVAKKASDIMHQQGILPWSGSRKARADGGYLPRQGGPSETRALKEKTASAAVETNGRPAAEDGRYGRAAGGRAARQAGGPLATPLAAGMGGQGRFDFNFPGNRSQMLADGGRAKAHERYGHGPGCSCPSCSRKGKADGGEAGGDPVGYHITDKAGNVIAKTRNSSMASRMIDRRDEAYGASVHGYRPIYDETEFSRGGPKARAQRQSGGGVDDDEAAPPAPAPGGRYNRDAVQGAIDSSNRRGPKIGGREAKMIHAVLKGYQREDKANGGGASVTSKGPPLKKQGPIPPEELGQRRALNPRYDENMEKARIKRAKELSESGGGRAGGAEGGSAGGKYHVYVDNRRYGVYDSKAEADAVKAKRLQGALSRETAPNVEVAGPVRQPARAEEWTPAGESEPRKVRATGGRSKSGKMNVNIIIGGARTTPGGLPPAGDPSQNPALQVRPPMPMPPVMPPGAAPPGAAAPPPMPMPPPMGPGAGPPPMMPSRARGGRAPEGGAGSGLGRLRKIKDYGVSGPEPEED
jgi:hypothetical protein